VLLVMVSAVVMEAVAFADIVIVVPLIAVMAVLAGMPAPVRTCPIANPVRLDTLVRAGLPEVVMAVNEVVTDTFVREALPEVVMPVNETVGPVMTCPVITPLRLVTFVIMLLPPVTVPVGVTTLLAVAGCDIVTVLAPTAVMVAPMGMPAAVRGWLGNNPNPAVPGTPAALDTCVMMVGSLFEVGDVKEVGKVALTMPLNVIWVGNALLAVAFADSVILEPMAEMVVPVGMPAPVMTCPAASPAVLDTGVRVVLPLLTMPVIATEPVAAAACDMVIVVPLVAVMVVPAGMTPRTCPGTAVVDDVMGCPTINPEMLDTPVMVLVLAVM
jgi:hypothetical protein